MNIVGRLKVRRKALTATLALVAAMAIGAAGAGAAQAATWHEDGSETAILSGNETEAIESSEGTLDLTTTVGASKVEVGCSPTTSGSIAVGGGASTIELAKCVVSKPAKCELLPAQLRAKVELVSLGGTMFEKFTQAKESEPGLLEFGTIKFDGVECNIKNDSLRLKGSFVGRELTEGQAFNRKLSFTKGEGEVWPEAQMTAGTAKVNVSGSLVQHLQSSGNWGPVGTGTWEVANRGPAFVSSQSTISEGGPIKFSTAISGSNVSFTCGNAIANGSVLVPGGTESAEHLRFSTCEFEAPASCRFEGNEFATGPVTSALVQVSGNAYEKFTPVGESITTLAFKGEKCGLNTLDLTFKGSLAAALPESGSVAKIHRLEFSAAAEAATGSSLHSGNVVMLMSGTMLQRLSGTRVGMPWYLR